MILYYLREKLFSHLQLDNLIYKALAIRNIIVADHLQLEKSCLQPFLPITTHLQPEKSLVATHVRLTQ
jgi:hypothetical protein